MSTAICITAIATRKRRITSSRHGLYIGGYKRITRTITIRYNSASSSNSCKNCFSSDYIL